MIRMRASIVVRADNETDKTRLAKELKDKIEKDTFPSLNMQNIKAIVVTNVEIVEE